MRTDIKFSYKEYRALPETGPRYQLVQGELVMSPSPTFRHQRISGRLFQALTIFVESKRLGVVCYAPLDVILDDENVFQPDVLFVAAGRKKIIAPEGIRGAPDLCVEILSPSNRDLDIEMKRVLYARYGVVEYWIVDPDANTLDFFRLQENPRAPLRSFRATDVLVSDLFPGLSIELSSIFAE